MVRELLTGLASRLWLTLALAVAPALALAALGAGEMGSGGQVLLVLATACCCFGIVHWALNQAARFRVTRWGQEAVVWAQAGMESQARSAFDKAMAVLDGWLPSLGARKRLGLWLGARFARFVLALPQPTARDLRRLEGYLYTFPRDEQVVSRWLKWCANNGHWRHFDSELFTLIAYRYPDDLQLQKGLARVFLAARRLDFAAMATYNKLLQSGAGKNPGLVMELAAWFRDQGRGDDTALAAYVAAVENGAAIDLFGPALAACISSRATADPDLVRRAEKILSAAPEKKRKAWQARSSRPAAVAGRQQPPPVSKPLKLPSPAQPGTTKHESRGQRSLSFGLSSKRDRRSKPAAVPSRILAALSAHRLAAWSVAAAVVVIAVSALFLLPAREPSRRLEPEKAPVEVARRFTVQVAAYIHEKDARSYVERLRAKGQEAFWTRAGKGQKTWFQVKIGRFADMAAARRLGNRLKNEGVIDDFYVSNYNREQDAKDGNKEP